MSALPDLEEFRAEARAWLAIHGTPRQVEVTEDDDDSGEWGVGSDNVAVFHNYTDAEETARLDAVRHWQRAKFDAGYAMINWPTELGGRGLPTSYVAAFASEQSRYQVPDAGELPPTSMGLIAPTIAAYGTPVQKAAYCAPLMRMDLLSCQLFSEPGAGSDLAGLATRAVRDGDEWSITGQKVWTSGARHSDFGLAITRTDFDVPKHRGLTAFLIPFDTPGVEVRAIQQMSGGANFNEVFLTDARVSDAQRLGAVGDGWRVAITCLGFERDHSGGSGINKAGGSYRKVLATAQHFGMTTDPTIRQTLADLVIQHKVTEWTNHRAAAGLKAGQTPGPEGSLGKLMWTANMTRVSKAITRILGPRLIADVGEWGTFAWSEHVLGAPGYQIAGGSDEIQRNIVGERVLGLPVEPRVDKDLPFNEAQRAGRGA